MTSSAGQRISCNVVETRRNDVARIFNIQRYSLNDGEGIRTVVFFKGCPHLCPWCANPESISGKIQTVRREAKCLHGFAPIFPDTCYHLTHYWLAAVDIPVASDNPVHYADAIRYNARTPLQGSLLPLTRLVWA